MIGGAGMSEMQAGRAKAYYVSDYDNEHGEIVFAPTPSKAKHWADLNCDYIDRRAERRPQYDKYVKDGAPKEVLFDDGWWFSCDNPKCHEYHVTKDDGGMIIDGKLYCAECAKALGVS